MLIELLTSGLSCEDMDITSSVLHLVQCTNHDNYLLGTKFMSVKILLLHYLQNNRKKFCDIHDCHPSCCQNPLYLITVILNEVINFHFISFSLSVDLTVGLILYLGWACSGSLCAGHEQFQPMDTPSTQ